MTRDDLDQFISDRDAKSPGFEGLTLQKDLERRLLKAMESERNSAKRWAAKVKEIRELVIPNCTHSKVEEYRWEHDDGYGSQKRMTGLQCVLCDAKKPWGLTMGQWIKAKDFSYES